MTVDVTDPVAPTVAALLQTSTELIISSEVDAKTEIIINRKTYVCMILEPGSTAFKMLPQAIGKVIDVHFVTIETKTYSALVISRGKVVVGISKQSIDQKMTLVIRDDAGKAVYEEKVLLEDAGDIEYDNGTRTG